MPSGLQPWTTNNSQNATFSFKPLTTFCVLLLCLKSFLFILSSCQDIIYTPLLGLQHGFYSQRGCWEATRVPGTCQMKILPLKRSQVLRSWYPLTGFSDAESLPLKGPHCALLLCSTDPCDLTFLSGLWYSLLSSLRNPWSINPCTVWNPSGKK